ncbi:hypothetical protein ACOTWR_06660 [Aliarcobacter butzleri]
MIKNIEDLIKEVSKAASELGCKEIKGVTRKKEVFSYCKKDCKINLDCSRRTNAELIVDGTTNEITKTTDKISDVLSGLSYRIVGYDGMAKYEINLPK